MTGKRTAHEPFPQVITAAVRVFTRDGCKSARMSDVTREVGLSEAALYRHALLLEVMPAEHFPLKAPCLREMIERSARELPEFADLLNLGFRAPVPSARSPPTWTAARRPANSVPHRTRPPPPG